MSRKNRDPRGRAWPNAPTQVLQPENGTVFAQQAEIHRSIKNDRYRDQPFARQVTADAGLSHRGLSRVAQTGPPSIIYSASPHLGVISLAVYKDRRSGYELSVTEQTCRTGSARSFDSGGGETPRASASTDREESKSRFTHPDSTKDAPPDTLLPLLREIKAQG